MKSVRQYILDALEEKLPKINTGLGYNNTIQPNRIYKGFKSLNQVNEYPTIFFGLAGETNEAESESGTLLTQKTEAFIGLYFQSENLTDSYESWISDFKRFIYTDTNKMGFEDIEGIQGWKVNSIEPYIADYDKNIGTLLILFEIKYVEDITEE